MEKIGTFLKDMGLRFISWLFMTFGLIAVWGWVLSTVTEHAIKNLHGRLGYYILMFFSIVGTPLHELSHWLGCKLFGFRIYDVDLFRPRAAMYDGVLGYVSFIYDKDNIWQQFGCTFTAMAPLVFGTIVMFLILRFAFPEAKKEIDECIAKAKEKGKSGWLSYFASFAKGYYYGLFDLKGWGVLRGILVTYVLISISMSMTLSFADIRVALTGIWIIAAAYLIFAIITAIRKTEYKEKVKKVGSFISCILSVGLFFNLIMFILTWIF